MGTVRLIRLAYAMRQAEWLANVRIAVKKGSYVNYENSSACGAGSFCGAYR